MNGKYLKRMGIICLSAAFLVGMTGCSGEKENTSESETEEEQITDTAQKEEMGNQLTQEELEAYEKADGIDIEELELKEDWDEKAEISLGDEITVAGTGAEVSEDTVCITEGGSYTITGKLEQGMIQVDTKEEVRLVLAGASITNTEGSAIYVKEAKSCYIETKSGTENTLSDGETYTDTEENLKAAVHSNDRLILSGEGTLTVNGNYKHAVCSDDEVYVIGGTYELTAVKDGIHTNNWISIEKGNINIVSQDDAMQSEGPIAVNGGNISITADDKGITAYGDLTVNDGTINITKCQEGLESKNDVFVNGGVTEITGSDDGLNARTSITISSGTLYAEISNGDALDSNGSMTIEGGLVLAFGAQMPEGGIDCDQNAIQITGGTVIGTGGTNSSPSETESSQISVLLGSAEKGEKIGVLDSQGNTVFAFEAQNAYSNMLLSTGTILSDQDYTVYTGGSIIGEGYHGYYDKGVYEGGTESVSFTTDGMVISAGGTSDSMGAPGGKGEMPQNGERPEMPKDGERPEMPEDGEMPRNGEKPENESVPENSDVQQNSNET